MNKTPFIKLIKKFNLYFFYDVNTNEIVKISEKLFRLFESKSDSIDISSILKEVDDSNLKEELINLMDQGYLSNNRPSVDKHFLSEYVEIYQRGSLNKLTLQVTQNCNFKCRYCGYAGTGYLNRVHNYNTMSFETACKAIDFFLAHSIDSKELNIGFYGGEPLLEGELIVKLINYVESKALGKSVTYRLTTNGSIINRSVFKFFEKHDVHMMVSLDGPSHIQNKNRRFAIDGSETFSCVEQNLKTIRQLFPNLYNNLSMHSVIDPSEDYNEYRMFFSNNEHFRSLSYSTSMIDDSKTLFKSSYSKDFIEIDSINEMLYYHNKLRHKERTINSIYAHEYEQVPLTEKFSRTSILAPNYHHGGACIPGVSRLFVDVRGVLYPCEKISELSECMKIGDIYTGFDEDNVQNQLNIVGMCGQDCSNCWAIRHCSICCNQIDNINGFSYKLKKDLCKKNKSSLLKDMEKYILLEELGKNDNSSR